MPELPDVEIFKKEADKALGKKVDSVEIKDRDFVGASRRKFKSSIVEKKLDRSFRKGKYLFLVTENEKAVALHFGMTGSLEYLSGNDPAPEYTKCIFHLTKGYQLCYSSKRKLGSVEVSSDTEKYIDEAGIGPDALEIGKKEFTEKLSKSRSMVKSFLMDQSSVAGIGNIYSDEILFQAGVHPKKKCSELSREKAEEIFRKMRRILKKAIEKDAKVEELPRSYLLPRRKEGKSCPKCKGRIRKIKVSGRSGYYCPSCQPKK